MVTDFLTKPEFHKSVAEWKIRVLLESFPRKHCLEKLLKMGGNFHFATVSEFGGCYE
jgi:hypothetical protein